MKNRFLFCLSLIAIFMFIAVSAIADDNPKEMYNAITAGDAAKVKTMLDSGFDPNSFMPDGQPALMAAANAGNAEIVSLFIKAGADVSIGANDILGGNALTGAVWSTGDTHDPANTIKIIQMLLDAGIDINSGEVRDESSDFNAGGNNWQAYVNPVWYVTGSSNCSADVLEFMLNKGCTPSRAFAVSEANGEKKDFGVDDLIDAVKKSKTNKADRKEYNRIVKLLKDAKDKQKAVVPAAAKAPEPAAPTQPQTQKPAPEVAAPAPLQQVEQPAVQQPKQPQVKQPKKAVDKPKQQKQPKELKTEPVKQTSAILTPDEATELLRKSVTDKNKENFYRSLVMGADINSVDKDNKTPLLLAVMSQSYEMVEVLIYKGADLNVRSKGGNTPLSMAKDLGATDIEKALLAAGAKE